MANSCFLAPRKSNILQVQSSEPVAKACPLGNVAIALMSEEWLAKVNLAKNGHVKKIQKSIDEFTDLHWPSRRSHNLAELSQAPEMKAELSGKSETLMTPPVWPEKLRSGRPPDSKSYKALNKM